MLSLILGVALIVFSGSLFFSKDFRLFFIPPAVVFMMAGLSNLLEYKGLLFTVFIMLFMLTFLIFTSYELIKGKRFFTLQGRLISKNNPLYQALEAYIADFLKAKDLSPQGIKLYPLGLIGIESSLLKGLDEEAFDRGLMRLAPKTRYLYNKLLGALCFLVGLVLVLSSLSKLI